MTISSMANRTLSSPSRPAATSAPRAFPPVASSITIATSAWSCVNTTSTQFARFGCCKL